jgi:hypothetical protein
LFFFIAGEEYLHFESLHKHRITKPLGLAGLIVDANGFCIFGFIFGFRFLARRAVLEKVGII